MFSEKSNGYAEIRYVVHLGPSKILMMLTTRGPRRELSHAFLSLGEISMGVTSKLTTQNKATNNIFVSGCFDPHSQLPMMVPANEFSQ